MDFYRLISSGCRQKILKTLVDQRSNITIMELVRLTNSTFNEVDRNLKILETEGIIAQKRFGRKRIIYLNYTGKKTLLLFNMLRAIDSTIDDIKQPLRNYQPCSRSKNSISKSLPFTERLNPEITKKSESTATNNSYTQKRIVTPDVLSLLSLPKHLRQTVVALYKMDQATAKDISKETKRPEAMERAFANQLVKLGYLKKRKIGQKVFFYIDTPCDVIT